jgi:hypothetical protein
MRRDTFSNGAFGPNAEASLLERIRTTLFVHAHIKWSVLFLILAIASQTGVAAAQNQNSRGTCSPNIVGQGNVTVNCPPPTVHTGACPANMIYSRTHGDCIPIQHRGGVIPCSPDDMSFIPGRGWVSNCQ